MRRGLALRRLGPMRCSAILVGLLAALLLTSVPYAQDDKRAA